MRSLLFNEKHRDLLWRRVSVIVTSLFGLLLQTRGHEFGTMTWDFTYDGAYGADYGESIRFDSQGRLAVAGWITSENDAQDALVFQITPGLGSTAVNWDETRDITGTVRNDRFYSLAIDSLDNIICTGVAAKPSAPYAQVLTEKFKPDGTSDWRDVWNPAVVGGTEAFANGIAINSADEAFTSTYFDIGSHNYINWGVRKYAPTGPGTFTGTLETVYTYDHGAPTQSYSYSNRIEGIGLDAAGDVCTVGRIGEGVRQRRNWHVRRYETTDLVTSLNWAHTEPASASGLSGQAYRIAIDSGGNPVVVGRIMIDSATWQGRIVKYDNTTGLPDWTIIHPAPKSSFYDSVYVDRMGYYWVGGYGTEANDALRAQLLRLDPADGTILNRLDWDNGTHLRSFDIRSRRLAVVMGDGDNIILEAYTPDPPEITLLGDPIVELEVHSDYIEPGFSAYDEFERENITPSVVVADLPDVHTVGTYTVRYNVDAYNGESAVERSRTVRIVDTTAPEITLQGGADIRVDAGVPYHEPGYDVTDNYDTGLSGSVQVSGSVDTATPGTYELQYMVSDASGNPAQIVTRTVRVVRLEIDTVEITDAGDVRITCETERGASYRILASPDMQDSPWDELAVVTTPDGQLDWSAPRSSEWRFLKVQRVVE